MPFGCYGGYMLGAGNLFIPSLIAVAFAFYSLVYANQPDPMRQELAVRAIKSIKLAVSTVCRINSASFPPV